MARERVVSKTGVTYSVNVLCVNDNDEPLRKVYTVGADFKPDNGLKFVAPLAEKDGLTAVKVKGYTELSMVYSVKESIFIDHAKKMPPRGTDGRTRERIVTRTIVTYAVNVLCVNDNDEPLRKVYTVGADFNPDNGLKFVTPLAEKDGLTAVKVKGYTENNQLYGMNELDFFQLCLLMGTVAEER